MIAKGEQMPEPTFKGQVAIVSGGLGDIGRATAIELARHGAAVAVGDIRPAPRAESLLRQLRELNVGCRYDRVDVSDAAAVRGWVGAVAADLGTPTLIVPNAATATVADVRTITPEQWSRELRVNLDGAFHLAQAAVLRLLEAKKPGRVVFLGSWAAHAPHTFIPAYCAAKAGLRMLCKCMALELSPFGILVNEVAPGYVDAGLSGRIFHEQPQMRQRALEQVPIRQLIEADEVARQVLHLCDPANRHMTGTVILMDGGLSLVPPNYTGK